MEKSKKATRKKTLFAIFGNILPTFLAIVAIISIVWYLLKTFGFMSKVWSLPVLAGCTGVLSLLIPMIGRRFAPVYAIISTGWTVLLLETLPFFGNRLSLISLLFAISIITDILVNGLNTFHFGDFILNAFMSAVAGFLIVKFGGAILNLIILIILFVLVILTNLKISLSLKKRKEKDYNPSDDSYVDDII